MREAVFLHYRPGRSLWHRHDARIKLGELAIWSILSLAGSPLVLAVCGLVILTAHLVAGTRVRRLGKPLLFWLVMAAAITLFAGLGRPDPPLVVFGRALPVGGAGLTAGAARSLRLLAVLLAGDLLASTTDPGDLADAVRRLSFFLPPLWSGALAAAFSLTISFIPAMLDEAATVRDAAFSRGLGQRRSPFRRAAALGLPLAESTLRRAEITADALLSRCFAYDPTPPEMRIGWTDWVVFAGSVLPPAAVAGFSDTVARTL